MANSSALLGAAQSSADFSLLGFAGAVGHFFLMLAFAVIVPFVAFYAVVHGVIALYSFVEAGGSFRNPMRLFRVWGMNIYRVHREAAVAGWSIIRTLIEALTNLVPFT